MLSATTYSSRFITDIDPLYKETLQCRTMSCNNGETSSFESRAIVSPTAPITNLLSAMCMLNEQSILAMLLRKVHEPERDAGVVIDVLIRSMFSKKNQDGDVYIIEPSVQLAIRELVQEFENTDKTREKASKLVWDN